MPCSLRYEEMYEAADTNILLTGVVSPSNEELHFSRQFILKHVAH